MVLALPACKDDHNNNNNNQENSQNKPSSGNNEEENQTPTDNIPVVSILEETLTAYNLKSDTKENTFSLFGEDQLRDDNLQPIDGYPYHEFNLYIYSPTPVKVGTYEFTDDPNSHIYATIDRHLNKDEVIHLGTRAGKIIINEITTTSVKAKLEGVIVKEFECEENSQGQSNCEYLENGTQLRLEDIEFTSDLNFMDCDNDPEYEGFCD